MGPNVAKRCATFGNRQTFALLNEIVFQKRKRTGERPLGPCRKNCAVPSTHNPLRGIKLQDGGLLKLALAVLKVFKVDGVLPSFFNNAILSLFYLRYLLILSILIQQLIK